MSDKQTQYKEVLNHLQTIGSITSMDAFRQYGITRLSAVIYELRKSYNIKTIMCGTKNRYGNNCEYAKYTLVEEDMV